MIRRLRYLLDQSLDIADLRAIGGDGDRLGAGTLVGERIEGSAGGVAGCGFAGGDVDFGAAGLEEAGDLKLVEWSARVGMVMGIPRCSVET